MPAGSTLRSVLVLVVFVLAAFLAAAIGGLATARGVVEWYPTLAKPSWTPPSWLFGPVWFSFREAAAISFIFFFLQF